MEEHVAAPKRRGGGTNSESFHSINFVPGSPVSLLLDSFPGFLSLVNITSLSATTFTTRSEPCSSQHNPTSLLLLPSHSSARSLRLLFNCIHLFGPEGTPVASQRSLIRVKTLPYVKRPKIP